MYSVKKIRIVKDEEENTNDQQYQRFRPALHAKDEGYDYKAEYQTSNMFKEKNTINYSSSLPYNSESTEEQIIKLEKREHKSKFEKKIENFKRTIRGFFSKNNNLKVYKKMRDDEFIFIVASLKIKEGEIKDFEVLKDEEKIIAREMKKRKLEKAVDAKIENYYNEKRMLRERKKKEELLNKQLQEKEQQIAKLQENDKKLAEHLYKLLMISENEQQREELRIIASQNSTVSKYLLEMLNGKIKERDARKEQVLNENEELRNMIRENNNKVEEEILKEVVPEPIALDPYIFMR